MHEIELKKYTLLKCIAEYFMISNFFAKVVYVAFISCKFDIECNLAISLNICSFLDKSSRWIV